MTCSVKGPTGFPNGWELTKETDLNHQLCDLAVVKSGNKQCQYLALICNCSRRKSQALWLTFCQPPALQDGGPRGRAALVGTLPSGRARGCEMKKVIKNLPSNPVFIEVPKPVNQMTKAELSAFVEEMVDALLGEESKNKGNDE